jgi:hypothetical protein
VRILPFVVLEENLFLPILQGEDKMLPQPAQEKSILPVHIVGVELYLSTLPLRASLYV